MPEAILKINPDFLRRILVLPDTTSIKGAEYNITTNTIELIIEDDDFPVSSGKEIPTAQIFVSEVRHKWISEINIGNFKMTAERLF